MSVLSSETKKRRPVSKQHNVIVVGKGNAAMCAALAGRDRGANLIAGESATAMAMSKVIGGT